MRSRVCYKCCKRHFTIDITLYKLKIIFLVQGSYLVAVPLYNLPATLHDFPCKRRLFGGSAFVQSSCNTVQSVNDFSLVQEAIWWLYRCAIFLPHYMIFLVREGYSVTLSLYNLSASKVQMIFLQQGGYFVTVPLYNHSATLHKANMNFSLYKEAIWWLYRCTIFIPHYTKRKLFPLYTEAIWWLYCWTIFLPSTTTTWVAAFPTQSRLCSNWQQHYEVNLTDWL
jgi:hypothetical protein